jgi:hypothetical protein
MPLRTQSLRSVHTNLEDQQSASSPLLQNERLGPEDPVKVDGKSYSIGDLPDELDSTQDLADEEIELEDIRDVTHVERCANRTEAGEPNM